jgi:hypothetical protein
LPTSNQSLSVGQQINFDVSYSAFWISTINTTTFTWTLYKQNTTGSGTQTQNLFNPISLSVTSTWAFWTLSALPIWYYDLRFSIMDSSWNITHEVVTFYVSNHNSWTDQNAPVISYHFPVNEQIIPTWNFTISLNYSDDASWIDLWNSEFILGKWNEDKGDYDILEYDYLSQLNANSSWFSYNALDLSYWKYIYIAVILDYVLNSKVISVEFFIDEPEIIIGSPIYEFTVWEQHNTELLIFVKTVWAPYKLELYKDSPLVNSFGNIIIDWNWNNWIWYDSYPYTWLKNIPSIPIFTNETPTLNRTGKKSVYEHKLKFNWAVDELQAAGKYEMNISIKGFFSY